MRFRLAPRLMTWNCYKFEFAQNFVISQIWEATTAKRMKTDLCTVSDKIVAH